MRTILIASVVLIPAMSARGQTQEKEHPKKPPSSLDSALRREILAMVKEDTETRNSVIKALRDEGFRAENGKHVSSDPAKTKVLMEQTGRLAKLDERNRTRLEQIVNQFGWPGKTLVGADGAAGAWLIVQHADGNLAFQKKCLELMRAAPRGELEPKHIAYLTDRTLAHEQKKQIYGTQLHGENGKLVPDPIEDEANVDKRRAEVGLEPLAEYLKAARAYDEKASGKAQIKN
jgi:hypothetical protein